METKEQSGYFIKIIILQCIFTVIILSSVLVVKYFFKSTYTEFKEWYTDNIAVDTDIYEVLGEVDEV